MWWGIWLLWLPCMVYAGDEKNYHEKVPAVISMRIDVSLLQRMILQRCALDNSSFNKLCDLPNMKFCDVSFNSINDVSLGISMNNCGKVSSLDLSSNGFNGSLSVGKLLQLFPTLQMLNVDDNKITDFLFSHNSKKIDNNTLKTISARNTHCVSLDLSVMLKHYSVQCLDLSDSKKLRHICFSDHKVADTNVLQIILKNTTRDFSHYHHEGNVLSEAAVNLVLWSGAVSALGAALLYQLPGASMGGGCFGMGFGMLLAHMLPNNGRRKLIEYVTG